MFLVQGDNELWVQNHCIYHILKVSHRRWLEVKNAKVQSPGVLVCLICHWWAFKVADKARAHVSFVFFTFLPDILTSIFLLYIAGTDHLHLPWQSHLHPSVLWRNPNSLDFMVWLFVSSIEIFPKALQQAHILLTAGIWFCILLYHPLVGEVPMASRGLIPYIICMKWFLSLH